MLSIRRGFCSRLSVPMWLTVVIALVLNANACVVPVDSLEEGSDLKEIDRCGPGQAIREVNSDGTVECATVDSSGSDGGVLVVDGLGVGVDSLPGATVEIDDGDLDFDTSGVLFADFGCSVSEKITVGSNGKMVCQPDLNNVYSNGSGVLLNGATFSANFEPAGSDNGTAGTVARGDHVHDLRYYPRQALDTVGVINLNENPVHWSRLKGVPSEFADGVDNDTMPVFSCMQTSQSCTNATTCQLAAPGNGYIVTGGGCYATASLGTNRGVANGSQPPTSWLCSTTTTASSITTYIIACKLQ